MTNKPNIYNLDKYKFIKIVVKKDAMAGITQRSCVTLFPL